MQLSRQNAFTLLEVLISILLLAIILTAGLSIYTNASAIMTKAMHKKIAMEMANEQMELIKNDGYLNLPNPAPGTWENPSSITFGDFTAAWRRRITDVEGTSPNIKKQIELEVSWTEADAQNPTTIGLATYMVP